MLIPQEKIDEAKEKYDGQAMQEIIDYFGLDFNEKSKAASCPFHLDKTPSFIWNEKNNCFHCFSCNRNFGIIDLYLEQGKSYLESVQKLFENVGMDYSFGEKGLHKKQTFKYPRREEDSDRSLVENYLSLRGISKKTLDYVDITQSKNNIIFNFYDSNDVLTLVKHRPAKKIEPGESKCYFQKDSDFVPILYNMNKVDPSKPLIITEGEIDCLSIIEAGYTNVVSVPNGSQNIHWIEHNWDWLEQFNKIIIWADNDAPGIKMRNDCCHRLGTWRTLYIDIKDERPSGALIKDANELLVRKGKQKVLEYIDNPVELPIEGITDLSTAEDFDIEKVEGLYTGIKDLDDKIYKLIFGTLNIITGKSGEGKSVFVNQVAICQALQQGYDVFAFSGELPAPILRNWVEVNMIGRDHIQLKENHVRVLDKEALPKMKNWYKGRVMVYDDSYDTTAKTILNKMEEMARKFGTKVFLIDNLMMVDLECSEEGRLQAEKDFIKNLIFFAKKFNVLVFLVAHPRKTGEVRLTKEDISGSSNIVNLAHMVFGVHRYTDKEKEGELNNKGEYIRGCEPVQYDSVVEVLKNRVTGLLPKTDLYFDYPSYRFYREPEELWFRYKWNDDRSPIRTDDPNRKERAENTPL